MTDPQPESGDIEVDVPAMVATLREQGATALADAIQNANAWAFPATCAHCGEVIVLTDDWCWVHAVSDIANCLPDRSDGGRYGAGDVLALLSVGRLPCLPATATPKESADV